MNHMPSNLGRPQHRSFNDSDGFRDVDWLVRLIGFSANGVAAHLSFDAALDAAMPPGWQTFIEYLGQCGLMPCRLVLRGE